MSHKRIWLSAACLLFLVGCTNTSSKTTKLEAPTLVLNSTRNGITWEQVKGATSYEITVDDQTSVVSFPGYIFALEYGDYEVSIVSVNDKGDRSDPAVYNYESRVTRLGNLQFDGTRITWPGSDYYELEVSNDGEHYTTITSNSLEVEQSGIYYFQTVKGFKEEGHIYYSQVLSKCIIATKGSTAPYIIEDATEPDDATLNEYYKKMKYTSGWEVAASYATIDNTSEEYVTGNAVDFHTWYHGMFYMFEKQVKLNGSFNEFDFTIRSSDAVSVTLSFQITHTFVVNGLDLNGVYIKYTLAEAPALWYKYRVSMDDPNWKVNFAGTDYSFGTVATMINGMGVKVQKLADMLPYFDVFQFRIKASYQEGGASAHTYFDDVQLLNSDITTTEIREIIPGLHIKDNYAFKGDTSKGGIQFFENGQAKLRITSPATLELDTTYTVEDEILTVTSANPGQDFVATFSSNDGGLSLKLESVTGTFASYLAGVVAESITLLDDFESYSATGVGYDANHGEEERSGLRGAYICDYWSGNSGDYSPIGGKEWNLMRSTDYLELSKDNAHTGAQAMNTKSGSNTMRFMSWCLHDGTGVGVRGKTFSFWAKGGNKADITMRVSVYSATTIGPSNHTDGSIRKSADITIPMNSGWTEYTIALDTTKLYYGFSFINLGTSALANTQQRIYVDDVYIYNNLSPWAE